MKRMELEEKNDDNKLSKADIFKVYWQVYTNIVKNMDIHNLLTPETKTYLMSKQQIHHQKDSIRTKSGEFIIHVGSLFYGFALFTGYPDNFTDINKLFEMIAKTKFSKILPTLKTKVAKNENVWSVIGYAGSKNTDTVMRAIEDNFCRFVMNTSTDAAYSKFMDDLIVELEPLSNQYGFKIEKTNEHEIILKDNGKNNLGRKKSTLQIASEAIKTGKYDAIRAKYKIPMDEYIVGLMRAYRQLKSYEMNNPELLLAWVTKQLGGLK